MRRLLKIFVIFTVIILLAVGILCLLDKQVLLEKLASYLPTDRYITFGRCALMINKVEGNKIRGIKLCDRRNPLRERVIQSEEAEFRVDTKGNRLILILHNGTIEENRLDDAKSYKLSFKKYILNLKLSDIKKNWQAPPIP